MYRVALAVMVVGLLFTASTLLHILSATYLAGVLSGLLIGAVLWIKSRRRHR